MGLEHAHRFARLHQQGLVLVQVLERGEDLFEAGPVARGAADAAIDHEVLRVLGHLGVEVVPDHAVGRFGDPVLAVQCIAAWCANQTRGVQTGVFLGGHDGSP